MTKEQYNQATEEEMKYKILDRDGIEMPRHYSGRLRTYQEASDMVEKLNEKGEYSPYTIKKDI